MYIKEFKAMCLPDINAASWLEIICHYKKKICMYLNCKRITYKFYMFDKDLQVLLVIHFDVMNISEVF